MLVELNGSNAVTTSYVYGAMGLLSQNVSGANRYLLSDVQGSTRVLLNTNNTVAADYAYDAFGSLTSTDSGLTKYLYTGQQYDSATELYSLRARYYAPELGRFLSRDTWEYELQNPRELNRYVYTANNPVMYSDPSGYANEEYSSLNISSKLTSELTVKQIVLKSSFEATIGYIVGLFVGSVFSSIRAYQMDSNVNIIHEIGEVVRRNFNPFDLLMSALFGAVLGRLSTAIQNIDLPDWKIGTDVLGNVVLKDFGLSVVNSLAYLPAVLVNEITALTVGPMAGVLQNFSTQLLKGIIKSKPIDGEELKVALFAAIPNYVTTLNMPVYRSVLVTILTNTTINVIFSEAQYRRQMQRRVGKLPDSM